jgi:hypothetical protein
MVRNPNPTLDKVHQRTQTLPESLSPTDHRLDVGAISDRARAAAPTPTPTIREENKMRELTIDELDAQLAEQLPARELMGGCCYHGGNTYNQGSFDGNGNGNGSILGGNLNGNLDGNNVVIL